MDDGRVRPLRRLLVGLGVVALVLGLVAGVADRQLMDTSRFVAHADTVRQDPAVARHLAVQISDRLVRQEPDLVAVRPLLEAALQAALVSPAFRSAFRAAVEPLHRAWTGRAPPTLVLRVADIGAILIAVTRAVLPAATAHVPADVEVRLARFGSGSTARRAVGAMRAVRLLAWLCPLLALLCLGGVVALDRGRRRDALNSVGLAVIAVGLGLAVASVVATLLVTRLTPDTVGGALSEAVWRVLAPSVRNTALVAAGAGYLLMIATSLSPGALRWRSLVAHAPVGTAVAAIVLGGLLITEPIAMLTVVTIAAGLVLVLHGVLALVRLLQSSMRAMIARRQGRTEPRRALLTLPAAVLALALLVGLVVWNGLDSTGPLSNAAAASTTDAIGCNGSAVLCGRRFDQVAYPATHNSMAAADQPGWFLAEQPDGVIDQLDAGIRAFLIDAWDGQSTQRPGVVANTDASHARALAQARSELGADVVSSALRLRDAAGLTPSGPVAPYLCHALCVLGSTRWEPLMVQVRTWLAQHPREVITFIVQDELPVAQVARVFEQSGLVPYLYTPSGSDAWPTLGQMIASGHRVVVMAEDLDGGTRYPWLMPAFGVMQETPFNARQVTDLSCRPNRGPTKATLFLVNHWLNQPLRRVRASRLANSDAVLGPRLDTCEQERGLLPNFVAVDYYDQGDLLGQVRRLNGLGGR